MSEEDPDRLRVLVVDRGEMLRTLGRVLRGPETEVVLRSSTGQGFKMALEADPPMDAVVLVQGGMELTAVEIALLLDSRLGSAAPPLLLVTPRTSSLDPAHLGLFRRVVRIPLDAEAFRSSVLEEARATRRQRNLSTAVSRKRRTKTEEAQND